MDKATDLNFLLANITVSLHWYKTYGLHPSMQRSFLHLEHYLTGLSVEEWQIHFHLSHTFMRESFMYFMVNGLKNREGFMLFSLIMLC